MFKEVFASDKDAWLWIPTGLASLRVQGKVQAATNIAM
jgi:hypothetical protein